MTGDAFVITCEHGGNRVPAPYLRLFRRRHTLLASHRGYDPGARTMARRLATAFDAPLVISTVSRLLIDLNRSIGHPRLFSAATRSAPADVRACVIERYYRPYRTQVEGLVREAVSRGRCVVHVSSHSFTPVLNGSVRRADVGLLYDPARPGETALCARWKDSLAAMAPHLHVRRNYPYAGKGDGLTAHLRRTFSPAVYVGVELEVNQRIVFAAGRPWTSLRRTLVDSLRAALAR
ncbi:MAG TPA: N-formylglutamate amidohydrolase [Casimicrobiaceae bacterium]